MSIFDNIVGVIVVAIFSSVPCWFFSRPGAWLLSKFKKNYVSHTTSSIFIVAIIRSLFYAPTILSGHMPILVPTYLGGLALSVHRQPTQIEFWWIIISPTTVFVASCFYEYYRSNKP